MNDDEIESLRGLAASAKRTRKGIWKYYSKRIGAFDFTLREPKKGEIEVLDDDGGAVIFPKLYRRQTNWAARKKAAIFSAGLQTYLAGQPDRCYKTDDYIENKASAEQHDFADFVQGGATVSFDFADLVFSEATSTIIDAHRKPITSF
jgi:hypothetical protein